MESDRVLRMKSDLASVSLDVKPLAEKSKAGTLSAEDSTRYDELIERMNAIGADLAKAINDDAQADEALKVYSQYNNPAGDGKRGPLDAAGYASATLEAFDPPKSIGQQFVESEQFKSYRNRKAGTSEPVKFDGLFPELDGTKALIYSGTATANTLLPQVYPTIYRPGEAPLNMRSVLLNLNTTSDALTVIQEASFTNSAAEVAEATTVSGGAKPESALTFSEATFPVRVIAHWIPITRQMLEDLPMMQGYVESRLRTGLARREDLQFIAGDGIAPNLTGILATSGIQNLDASYFSGAPVQDASTDNENVNRLRRAKRVVQVTGRAYATFAVINPVDKEQFDTITDTTKNYLFGGPASGAPDRMWGLQIVESENITAGTALVGDGTMAAVVDRRDAQIYVADQHSDFFIRNIFVMLAEERVALPVFRPAAFAKVVLAAWS